MIIMLRLGRCIAGILVASGKSSPNVSKPAQVLHTLEQILMVEVWFDLRRGG
jgi:hypothetical protein